VFSIYTTLARLQVWVHILHDRRIKQSALISTLFLISLFSIREGRGAQAWIRVVRNE
jgi:hypothetical protein